ncbi:hypothetical protein FJU08_12815 [Martelella alba]|uniref:Uncharacterized protein n=1 Tax=Martelella alba TaxID=2590451 RepID=A0A506U5R2_9HYPH|nr:hypothetical protein [Martelella alba]TPW29693.1 hypothetical protein FJU08_12815 [Martelella alba]
MSGPRIIRIVCPHCQGRGYFADGVRCTVCAGSERISADDARAFAIDQRRAADANGPGELSWPQKRKCAAVAEQVFETLRELPPWRRHYAREQVR